MMSKGSIEKRLKKNFEKRLTEEKDIEKSINDIKDQVMPITREGDSIEIEYKNGKYNIVRLKSDMGIKRFVEDEKELIPFSELSVNLHEELIRVILSEIEDYQIRENFMKLNIEITRRCGMITHDFSL